ncbi:site-specific DNA-methyltransferase [Kibdelosporangium philippinense]|uniref:Methyltransferase n=1 Tax=Kibdelosporangium philippinense TaxID=211113 RepID=A0ABS8ZH48_9PSEU|nr:site-specific DNA-methyltransferase [Kibdelosporangium philippinense]MCE7007064.1 site-specific DNA-methyltransferase [Kibdelosporangium philippinense]MCE7007124.1 site-specific DNA-methyltransferase [Kibdelosporangium philippinense]
MSVSRSVSLHVGDALQVLRRLAARSVHCVVTSPPYWGLRDYRVAGQYGHESTVEKYVAQLCDVFKELGRVLVSDGTVWLNLGDCFGGSWGGYVAAGSTAPSASDSVRCRYGSHRPPQSLHRAKDLVGVPWRVALALADRGWLIEDAIVWHKPNARPESVQDRLSQRYEMIFQLTPAEQSGDRPSPRPAVHGAAGTVWVIPSPRTRTAHIAAGSLEVARRCIGLSAPAGGVVLDPFSGTGTTGVAARQLGRVYIGIDLDPASHAIAVGRLASLR